MCISDGGFMTETCGGVGIRTNKYPIDILRDNYTHKQELKRECRLKELEEKFKAGEELTLAEEIELKGRRVGELLDSIFSIPCKS